MPESYLGRRFSDIASDVYKDKDILLFAVEVQVNDKPNGQILLNPGNYTLPSRPMSDKNKFQFFGYVIADDKDTAEACFRDADSKDPEEDEDNAGNDIDKNPIEGERLSHSAAEFEEAISKMRPIYGSDQLFVAPADSKKEPPRPQ